MSKIKMFFIGLLIVIVGSALFFYFVFPKKDEDVFYKVFLIKREGTNSEIYIKKKVWGMTSDHQVIVISNKKEKQFVPAANQNYIYNGMAPLFYKLQKDSLYIYTYKVSSIPKDLITDFKIIQIELENPEMMKLLEHDNYKNQGLMLIN